MTTPLRQVYAVLKSILQSMPRTVKFQLLLSGILMMVAGFLSNAPALFLGKMLDGMNRGSGVEWLLLALMAVAIFARESLTILRKYLAENACTWIEMRNMVSMIAHVLKLPMSFYTGVMDGELNRRIMKGVGGTVTVVKLAFLEFLPAMCTAVVALAIAIMKFPLLGVIMAVSVPSCIALVLWQIRSQEGIRVELKHAKEKINGKIVELLPGISTVRSLNTEEFEVGKVAALADDIRGREMRHHISMAFFDAFKYLGEGIFHIATITVSIVLALDGTLTIGDVLTVSLLYASVSAPIRALHRILDESHEASIMSRDFQELLATVRDPSFDVPEQEGRQENSINNAAIAIENITYEYEQLDKQFSINEVDFFITAGETIGIAGYSGCGKSTLLKLILGFSAPSRGRITIFGRDIRQCSRKKLAEVIGYIPQNAFMHAGTIRENILYGVGAVNEEELDEACKKACIYDEIMNTLGGYEGAVAQRGENLSGGQRQRILIARLLLKKPPVILLDEATSALDAINERNVQRALEELMKGKTVVIIAHRLSTLRNANRIVVMANGTIDAVGTYSILAQKNVIFRKMLRDNAA